MTYNSMLCQTDIVYNSVNSVYSVNSVFLKNLKR